jgi:hypothetical protein
MGNLQSTKSANLVLARLGRTRWVDMMILIIMLTITVSLCTVILAVGRTVTAVLASLDEVVTATTAHAVVHGIDAILEFALNRLA